MVDFRYLGKARGSDPDGELGGLQPRFSSIVSNSPLPINTQQNSYYANAAVSHI